MSNRLITRDMFVDPPRWLTTDDKLPTKERASIFLSFKKEEDAKQILRATGAYRMGEWIRVAKFESRRQIIICAVCQSYRHSTKACRSMPRCKYCKAKHKTEDHQCQVNECGAMAMCEHVVCVNCDGGHAADDRMRRI